MAALTSLFVDSYRDLLLTYHELNEDCVEELSIEPSPLQFMKYVAKNQPFVVRGAAGECCAVRKWNASYLTDVMGDSPIKVAITPFGNADSVVKDTVSGRSSFVKPLEAEEPFSEFLNYVRRQEKCQMMGQAHVKYAQTQNDNLRGEYLRLFEDVENDISWARIALGLDPEAINLWIGNSQSVSALHKDSYENIFCQVVGSKRFVLIPPVEAGCVNEQKLPSATYTTAPLDRDLVVTQDEPPEFIPFATWDPDKPAEQVTPFSHLSRPLRVELEPGDMLYLPALWYHKVSQSCSEEGLCCSVNYWYDFEFGGPFYSSSVFIRNIASNIAQQGQQ